MNVFINNIDITKRLLDGYDVTLYLERERSAYERIVGDINLVLSDIDRFFTNFFANLKASDKYLVKVYDGGKLLFKGYVDNTSIEDDRINRIVRFNAFSVEKEFWDRCKIKKINRQVSFTDWGKLYVTLDYLINLQIRNGFEDLIKNEVVLDTRLSDKKIRFWMNTADTNITNIGKYSDLEPETSVYDLFKALCINYNAEFYIDVEKDELNFRIRENVNDKVIKIGDENIIDEVYSLILCDDDKYDYVKYNMRKPKTPYTPSLVSVNADFNGGLFCFTKYDYIFTIVKNNIEYSKSDMYSLYIATMLYIGGTPTLSFRANLYIPSIPSDVSKICLYRRMPENTNSDLNKFRKIAEFYSGDFIYEDNLYHGDILNNLQSYPELVEPKSNIVYIRYNELLGVWEDIRYDEPNGKIYNAIPELKFANELYKDENNIYYFFGQQDNIDFVYDLWKGLMTTKRKILFKTNINNINIGDVVELQISNIIGNRYRANKVEINLVNNISTIEGVSI